MRDTRMPTSVHRIGRYTVMIYDEEAYQAMIAEDGVSTVIRRQKKQPMLFVTRKARGVSWAKPLAELKGA